MFKSSIINISDLVTKFSLYLLIFLVPLFFFPFTSDVLDFNKQALIIAFTMIALFAWMLKTLVSGRFDVHLHKINIAAGVLLLAYLVSTIFSVFKYGSFWGFWQVTGQSFISMFCFVLLYFLISSVFEKSHIKISFLLLGISIFIAQIFAILQILGWHLPFAFLQSNNFNTIGSLGSFGIWSASLLPFCIIICVALKRWWKILYLVNIALLFLGFLLINYYIIWILVAVASALVILFWVIKRDMFDGRWMFLPIFFLAISLFFIIFNPQFAWLPSKAAEINLSQKTTFDLDRKHISVIGSGPGTFLYNFQKYKPKDFNNETFWNINFTSGASAFLTDLMTIGVVGALVWVLLLGGILFYGVGYLFKKTISLQDHGTSFTAAVLAVLILQSVAYFLYPANISLSFTFFVCLAIFVSLTAKQKNSYFLKSSSLLTLATTSFFTLLFIFCAGLLALGTQRYVADIYYARGLKAYSAGQKDAAIKDLKVAANNNGSLDSYFNSLAFFSLSKLQDVLANSDANSKDPARQQEITVLISDAVSAANKAVALNPNNIDNWSTKGYVCQNLIGVFSDATDCAITSYDKAIELSPVNPYLLIQKGNAYIAQAENSPENKDESLSKAREQFTKAIELKNDYALAYLRDGAAAKLQGNLQDRSWDLEQAAKYSAGDANFLLQIGVIYYQDKSLLLANEQFQKALLLVPDYANALYYLGLTYSELGQTDKAIEAFEKLLRANPDNETIKKILDNLHSGKSALSGLVPEPPTPVTPKTTPSLPSPNK